VYLLHRLGRMKTDIRVLLFAASLRKESLNGRLARTA